MDYEWIRELPIEVLPVTADIMDNAPELSRKFNLFTSDAVHITVMKSNNLVNIASDDESFTKIESVKVWKPSKER